VLQIAQQKCLVELQLMLFVLMEAAKLQRMPAQRLFLAMHQMTNDVLMALAVVPFLIALRE